MTDEVPNIPSNGDSTERYYAEMEAARNTCLDAYFIARPQLLRTHAEESIFRAGFERAFSLLWGKHSPVETSEAPWVAAADRLLEKIASVTGIEAERRALIALMPSPEKASEQECRRAGLSEHAAGTGTSDTRAEARSSRREVTAPLSQPHPESCACWECNK